MSGLNQCSIIGNLGSDAELRDTAAGPVLKLRVAVSERVKRGDSWDEQTTWFGVAIFGKRAEALSRLGLSKGTKVYVSGPVQARAYQKDGEARASLDLIARELVLLGGGGQRSSGGGGYGGKPASSPAGGDDFGDDDIPFGPVDERAH